MKVIDDKTVWGWIYSAIDAVVMVILVLAAIILIMSHLVDLFFLNR